ncbi:hypothetical protein N0V83_004444 [Neocucurbitaria cava]|uniref:Heterokaryon incompatibility domain-containing protein n=1 Tax=Neocucurbitaria cava TaxID=798079 RepID=A0A9W8Y9H1_9PLEO|nr:hypothetical protein N0V83_004444 [Neocucurbitaria cava]
MDTLWYEAVSYNWGIMDATEDILVDGCKKKVTRSVYEILTSYSSLFLPKLLWIDALCIDQTNDAEKSQQVPLMEKIYLNAIFTTVFLARSPLADGQDKEHGVQLSHPNLFNILRMHKFRLKYRPEGWNDDYSLRMKGNFDLPNVLEKSSYFKSTNPRDLIFGVMSLCEKPLNVDYALSVEDIYLAAAERLLGEGASEILFHSSGVGNIPEEAQLTLTLRSWVPDWRATPNYKRLQNRTRFMGKESFAAGGQNKLAISVKHHRLLVVSGYLVDKITVLGPALFDTCHTDHESIIDETHHLAANYAACVRLFFESTRLSASPYPHAETGQSVIEAFRRTLFLDRKWVSWDLSSDKMIQKFPKWENEMMLFCDRVTLEAYIEKKDAFYKLLKRLYDVTQIIKSCCGGRRIFITRNGYIGLCPPYTKQGDLICVVPGLHVPLLLRPDGTKLEYQPLSGSTTRVKSVGECYVHGIMNGEALSKGYALKELEIV